MTSQPTGPSGVAGAIAFELEKQTRPARNRLTQVFNDDADDRALVAEHPDMADPPDTLINAVGFALTGADAAESVTAEHIDDALTLIKAARADLDATEAHLITAARERGRTWEQIAAALGYPDRRAAQTRHKRLINGGQVTVFDPSTVAAGTPGPIRWRPPQEQVDGFIPSETRTTDADKRGTS